MVSLWLVRGQYVVGMWSVCEITPTSKAVSDSGKPSKPPVAVSSLPAEFSALSPSVPIGAVDMPATVGFSRST